VHEKYHLPVIFLTAYSDTRVLERAKVTEPYGYILKPFQDRELHSTIEMAVHKSRMERKIQHLNEVLRSIRDINQLIVRVTDFDDLLRKVCESLIAYRRFATAWITITVPGEKRHLYASAGFQGKDKPLQEIIESGNAPECIEKTYKSGLPIDRKSAGSVCPSCPITGLYQHNEKLVGVIRYLNQVYGFLVISLPGTFVMDEEEIILFREIADDIGFAINALITRREKEIAGSALLRAKEEWEKTFDSMPDLIAILDKDHTIMRANKAMQARIDASGTTTLQLKCFEVVHGSPCPPDYCPHVKTISENKEVQNEVEEKNLGGIFDVTTTPIFDETGILVGSVHIAHEITQRKRLENLLKASLEIGEFSLNHSLSELLVFAIDKAEEITNSKIGFLHFVAADQKTVSLQNWSSNTTANHCKSVGNENHYPIENAGVWVDCALQRKPVIHNDYASLSHRKGLPEGHAELIRELCVPIIRGELVTGILGVGNKETGYDETDVETLVRIGNLLWEFVVNKRYEEAIRKKVEELQWMNQHMIDREIRMIELKKEVNLLHKRLGEDEKYVIHESNSNDKSRAV
jgi:GAF domain-containing protein